MKRGLLLVNLGTPDAPTTPAVRRYLREFLSDPYVIDIPKLARWLLLYGIILPFRPKNSAHAYQKVWREDGSPLLVHTKELTEKVQRRLENEYVVAMGMRYGTPSLGSALEALLIHPLKELVVLPLYPQYSLAATASSVDAIKGLVREHYPQLRLKILPAFYNTDPYLDAAVEVSSNALKGESFDHYLFSFHGLPERQVKKTASVCFETSSCCDAIGPDNQHCYRAQSFATARSLAKRLGIKKEDYTVCFQSRLGRTPWIQPYTDVLLTELPKKGFKRIAVFCPSFVADCLETLEEIDIRGKASFIENGGKELFLVPSLNASDPWARAVSQLVQLA